MTTRREILDSYRDDEIATLAKCYDGLASTFMREHLKRTGEKRHLVIKDVLDAGDELAADLHAYENSPLAMQRTAYEWLKTLVSAGFSGVNEDPRRELAAMKRRLLVASLVCIEAGGLELEEDEA